MENPLKTQIGGTHYQKYDIQPIVYACMMWGASVMAFNITRYIMRYQDKNGIEDLQKASHCCDLAVQIMGTWTNVHNLSPQENSVFMNFIDIDQLEEKELLLRKVAQFDFMGAKRDIEDLIKQMEGGEQ